MDDLRVHGSLVFSAANVPSAAKILQHNTAEAICCSHCKLKSGAEIEKSPFNVTHQSALSTHSALLPMRAKEHDMTPLSFC